ncbi:hypothetical protein ACFL5U_02655 [Candidatus Margulisiibacteriota bacterium]
MKHKKTLFVAAFLLGILILSPLAALAATQATGTLQVFSEEEEVYIYINGYLKGKNSVIRKDIQVGQHYIKGVKGKKDGPIVFSKVVSIKKDEVNTVVIPAGGQPAPKVVAPASPKAVPAEAKSATPAAAAVPKKEKAVKKKPGLPIKVMDMDPMVAKEKGLSAGVYVTKSNIHEIDQGDIVISMDKNPIKDAKFYNKFLGFLQVGDNVLLEVLSKEGKEKKVKVKVIDVGKIEAKAAAKKNEKVALNPEGKYYHRKESGHVSGPDVILLTRAEAEKKDYKPCKLCYSSVVKTVPKETSTKEVQPKESKPKEEAKEEKPAAEEKPEEKSPTKETKGFRR